MNKAKIGLRNFAVAISALTIIGHLVLGFESSWAQVLATLATTYVLETGFEVIQAKQQRRPMAFLQSFPSGLSFFYPAHITGLAIAMLLYPGGRIVPFVFAGSVAICSKVIFRTTIDGKSRHFLNPSNTGITAALLLFPSIVSIAPPYEFTEYVRTFWDIAIPVIIVASGTFLNYKLTGKHLLILGWLSGFVAQALVRSIVFGDPVLSQLMPMTGVAFILFTFYMISDPATTPFKARAQVGFGLAVALAYGVLIQLNVPFTLFFALVGVCVLRGSIWAIQSRRTGAGRPPQYKAQDYAVVYSSPGGMR